MFHLIEWSWWVLALIPVAWFFQNCVHEFSHLAVAYATQGRRPTGFYPFYHKHEGIWYFARYSSGVQRWGGLSLAPTLIAPFFGGIAVTTTALILKIHVVQPEHMIFLVPFSLAGFIDSLWFIRGVFWGSIRTDGKRFKKEITDMWLRR